MRYARTVVVGAETRLTEVVEIPSPVPYGKDVAGFLALMYGNAIPFIRVADDNVSGAVRQQDGSFLNPSLPVPLVDKQLDWSGLTTYLIGLLDPDANVGRAKLQTLIEAARDKIGTTDNDKLTRNFYTWFNNTRLFTRADTVSKLLPLVGSSILTNNQVNAINSNWPQV